MSKSNRKNKKLNIIGKFIGIIFDIMLIAFLGLITYMNVLPSKYYFTIIILLLLFTILNNMCLFITKIKKELKIFFITLSIIFIIIFGFGISYLYNTVDFLNTITSSKEQIENYYVVVLDNNTYDKIDDLKTDNLGIHANTSDTFNEAKEELLKKVKTKNTEYDDSLELANDLLKEKIDAMFVSEAYKANLDDEVQNFKSKTKIIYTVSIKTKAKQIVKDVKVTQESFNIFISGIDTYGSIKSVSRSDVNMIVTVNPNSHEILFTSIPRDYYVQLNGTKGLKDKLTHAGTYGIDKSVKTLEDLFDIDINYFVKVNFSTLIDVVDIIGGIDVYSDATFIPWTDPSVRIKTGNMHMNGKTALAFARERHAYKEGDRHRVKNQQDVLTAIMNKMLSSKTLISKYNNLLNTLDGSFQTNMSTNNLTSLIKKQIDSMPEWSFISQSVNGSDASAFTYSYSNQKLYVMIPDMNTVNIASVKIKELLEKK